MTINVRDFGMSESNSPEQNNEALRLALQAASAQNGGLVVLPAGKFKIKRDEHGISWSQEDDENT